MAVEAGASARSARGAPRSRRSAARADRLAARARRREFPWGVACRPRPAGKPTPAGRRRSRRAREPDAVGLRALIELASQPGGRRVDLNDTPEQAQYREKVRSWLEEHRDEAPVLRGP